MPLKKSFFNSGLRSLLIVTTCHFLLACSNSIAIEKNNAAASKNQDVKIEDIKTDSPYKGWDFLAEKLINDGIPQSSVDAVFKSDQMPAISFIPFKLNPIETQQIYNTVTSQERLDRAEGYLDKYREEFSAAEQKYGVSRFVIAAIISVETNWGSFVGNEKVLYRLARIASTGESINLMLNFKKLNSEDPTITYEQTKTRSEYLFNTFYPHIVALFHNYKNKPQDILALKGSIAGAFGLPQFLPKSLELFGVDGNNDAVIDLFNPEDAIFSVANFLKSNGWHRLMTPQEKLAVLWHYNRSDAYGRAIIRVSLSLQNRFLGLN